MNEIENIYKNNVTKNGLIDILQTICKLLNNEASDDCYKHYYTTKTKLDALSKEELQTVIENIVEKNKGQLTKEKLRTENLFYLKR